MKTTMPARTLRLLRKKHWEDIPAYLNRVEKVRAQVQSEIDVWITNPTREGILTTHRLEEEKQLILKIIAVNKD